MAGRVDVSVAALQLPSGAAERFLFSIRSPDHTHYFVASNGGGGMVRFSVSMRIFHVSPPRTSVVVQ
jgi:hypothetical protein